MLLGQDTEVPCADGRMRRYVNLDYAASAPALADVWAAVEAFMPWYSSVHRGSGVKSQVATEAFEGARDVVAQFHHTCLSESDGLRLGLMSSRAGACGRSHVPHQP